MVYKNGWKEMYTTDVELISEIERIYKGKLIKELIDRYKMRLKLTNIYRVRYETDEFKGYKEVMSKDGAAVLRDLISKNISHISYELIHTEDGELPIWPSGIDYDDECDDWSDDD